MDNDEKYAQQIIDSINHFGDQKKMAEYLTRAHPTLQQSFARLAVYFFQQQATKTYADLRNQASVDIAKKIVAALGDDAYLPLV